MMEGNMKGSILLLSGLDQSSIAGDNPIDIEDIVEEKNQKTHLVLDAIEKQKAMQWD